MVLSHLRHDDVAGLPDFLEGGFDSLYGTLDIVQRSYRALRVHLDYDLRDRCHLFSSRLLLRPPRVSGGRVHAAAAFRFPLIFQANSALSAWRMQHIELSPRG